MPPIISLASSLTITLSLIIEMTQETRAAYSAPQNPQFSSANFIAKNNHLSRISSNKATKKKKKWSGQKISGQKIKNKATLNNNHSQGKTQKPRRQQKPSAQNIRKIFRSGEALFHKQNFLEATKIFASILSRHPTHEPTIILYARTAYRLGRIDDAYRLFARSSLANLATETRYEYGQSFFQKQGWAGAIRAFSRIATDHSLGDLARYFQGVSLTRLRRYAEAKSQFLQALVLPDNLRTKKLFFLNKIEEISITLNEQRRKSARRKPNRDINRGLDNPFLSSRQLAYRENAHRKSKSKSKKTPTKKSHLNTSNNINTWLRTNPYYLSKNPIFYGVLPKIMTARNVVRASTYQNSQLSDTDGLSIKRSTYSTNKVEALLGIDKKIRQDDSLPGYYGLEVLLAGKKQVHTGSESRILQFEDQQELQRIQTSHSGEQKTTSGTIEIITWAVRSIVKIGTLEVRPSVEFTLPDFTTAAISGTRGLSITYLAGNSRGQHAQKFSLLLKYSDIFEQDLTVTTNLLTAKVGIFSAIYKDWWISATVTRSFFRYMRPSQEGPDNSVSFKTSVIHNLPLNFSLSGTATFNVKSNTIIYTSNSFDSISSTGLESGFRASAIASPWPWIELTLSQSYYRTRWQDINPRIASEEWELLVPNYIEKFNWSISVQKFF